jgi:hypothetical protein
MTLANLLELKRWMCGIGLEQPELSVRPAADVIGKRCVFLPESRGGEVVHQLQSTRPTVCFIIQGVKDCSIQSPGGKIGSQVGIDGLWVMPIQPGIKLLQFLRRQAVNCAFNVVDRAQTITSSSIVASRKSGEHRRLQ